MKCKCGCGENIGKICKYYPNKQFCKGHRLSPKTKEVHCDNCFKLFTKSEFKLKHNFCSFKCTGEYKSRVSIKFCNLCGIKYKSRTKNRKYCSRKCSALVHSGNGNPSWKSPELRQPTRYVDVKSDNIKKKEHRLIIERAIGRELLPKEIVHHINKIKTDNRLSNLMLFDSSSNHTKYHNNPKLVSPEHILFDGSKVD
jgi:hypothetical protein